LRVARIVDVAVVVALLLDVVRIVDASVRVPVAGAFQDWVD